MVIFMRSMPSSAMGPPAPMVWTVKLCTRSVYESLEVLAELLDHADQGHWPTSWSEARTVLVPNLLNPLLIDRPSPDGNERVLSCLGQKARSQALSKWLNSWGPSFPGRLSQGFQCRCHSAGSCRDHQSCPVPVRGHLSMSSAWINRFFLTDCPWPMLKEFCQRAGLQ